MIDLNHCSSCNASLTEKEEEEDEEEEEEEKEKMTKIAFCLVPGLLPWH